MIQLAFALLPVVWRYALIAGMIYVAGHYLGWAVLEAYSRAALNVVQGFGYELGAPMAEISAWVSWVLGLFPASVPIWIRVLCLLCALSALKSYQVRWALRDLLHPTQKLLKWILWAPYRLLRRLTLIRFAPFGKSRWARLRDLKREGMLKPGGLFLGQFSARKHSVFRRYDLYHHGEGHFITIALPGGGKTTAAVIPPLLTATEGSFVVTDPKGEVTAITRRHRASMGKVFYLNPFHADFSATTGLDYPDSGMNPFDLIEAGDNTRAQADALARYLMVTDRKDSGSYFQDEGAELLALFITWMAKYEPPENKTLTYLYELVRDEHPLRLFEFMDYVDDPHIKHEVGRYRAMVTTAPQQWTGAISKAQLATKRYVPQTPLGRHVEKSGFDPRILKTEDVTVYILLPPEHVETAAPWLNMVIGLLGKEVGKPGKARPVTMMLEELPALGYLPDLRPQMRLFRSAGLRMWLFSQTVAALSSPEMYGKDGMRDLFGLCHTKQFFAIGEHEQAAEISRMCGKTSRKNRSQSTRDESDSVSAVEIPLIRPEEILQLKRNEQILLRGGMAIRARLIPYYSRKSWLNMTDDNPYRA